MRNRLVSYVIVVTLIISSASGECLGNLLLGAQSNIITSAGTCSNILISNQLRLPLGANVHHQHTYVLCAMWSNCTLYQCQIANTLLQAQSCELTCQPFQNSPHSILTTKMQLYPIHTEDITGCMHGFDMCIN